MPRPTSSSAWAAPRSGRWRSPSRSSSRASTASGNCSRPIPRRRSCGRAGTASAPMRVTVARARFSGRRCPVNPIPLVDLAAQHAAVAAEVAEGWQQVLARTAFIDGPQVAEFESEYAAFTGARHCVGVANGTDAIEIALRALGVDTGDECILPANTFIATAEAVCRAGATPVLVDCAGDGTYLIDTEAVEAAVTGRTRAIIPVHLYGQAAPVERLLPLATRIGAWVVEDAAQSQGARRNGASAGALADAAATSFYPGKNLGA